MQEGLSLPAEQAGIPYMMKEGRVAEKILIVDDEEDYVNLLRLILAPEGFEVETACDGEQALAKVAVFKPDLMILDVNMPKLDGHGVCKKVRENAGLKKLPIIMLTVRSNEEEEVRGLENGSDDYITKPFEPTTLVTRVRTVLRRAKRRKLNLSSADGQR